MEGQLNPIGRLASLPVVILLLAVRSSTGAETPGELHVWVFFMDKGERSGADMDLMLEQATRNLIPRARARRLKNSNNGIVDFYDIPVCNEYVKELQQIGVKLRRKSRWLNAVSVEAERTHISMMQELPFVSKLAPVRRLGRSIPGQISLEISKEVSREVQFPPDTRDLPLNLQFDPADSVFYGPSYPQLRELGIPAVHDSGYTGAGVLVGLLDTGYYKDHRAFEGLPIIAEYDFVFDDDETQNEPEDDPDQHEHGTASWSILGGYAPYSQIGPAYGASFVLAKTEDIRSETPVEEDNFVAALEWADSLGVDLVSASLAYRFFDDPDNDYEWEDLDGNTATTTVAVDIAASKGILVICGVGNYGPDPGSLGTPADADSVIAVGGVNGENGLIWFSSRGPTWDGRTKPEVLARGQDVYHAFPANPPEFTYSGGTSVATALVGGAAALVMEAHPDWTIMEVRSALMWTADRALRADNDYGWGRINVHSAIYKQAYPRHIEPVEPIAPGIGESVE